MMLIGILSLAAVYTEARTQAPPPMSARMASMLAGGFREMPPLKNKNNKHKAYFKITCAKIWKGLPESVISKQSLNTVLLKMKSKNTF